MIPEKTFEDILDFHVKFERIHPFRDGNKQKLGTYFSKSKYDNINELLDKVIFDNKPAAIIVIDEATDELYNVMAQLTMSTEVIEAQTYLCGDKKLHRFSPFKDEVVFQK